MKKYTVTIAKKEFPLVFTLGTMEMLEETIKGFDLTNIDKVLRSTKGLLDVLFCMAKEGSILDGKPMTESRQWFGAHCPASKTWIVKAHEAIVNAMIDGMSMETDDDQENEEVDVVLQELKKNEETTS
jgi:hypothetical protein